MEDGFFVCLSVGHTFLVILTHQGDIKYVDLTEAHPV